MAHALRCSHCGAPLPSVTPDRASVECDSCRRVHRVDPALLEELHRHHREVGAQRGQAARARRAQVGVEVSRSLGRGWAAAFALSWVVTGALMIPHTAWASTLAALVFAAPFAALLALLPGRHRRFARGIEAARAREAALVLHCPTCGGQSECLPDQPVLACGYCRGALAADEPARVELLARARASASEDQHRARVASWRLAARQNREPRSDLVPFAVLGGLAALWGTGALLTDLRWLLGVRVIGPGSLLALNLSALVMLGGLALGWSLRRARLNRLLRAMAALGDTRHELTALAEWLVAHWRGPFASSLICAGAGYVFVARAEAPWWAVSYSPWTQQRGSNTPHLRVLVPGRPGAMLDGWAARLSVLGFECRIDDGGLVATLRPAVLARWTAEPGAFERLRAALQEPDRD